MNKPFLPDLCQVCRGKQKLPLVPLREGELLKVPTHSAHSTRTADQRRRPSASIALPDPRDDAPARRADS